jgi:hypothetical protein
VAKSTWRKAGNERFRPIHRGVKNYNEVPTRYSPLAHKRRTLVWQCPFSGCSLERWHKMERCRGGTASLSQHRNGRSNVQAACDCYECWPLHYLRILERGTVSALLQGKRCDFLLPEPAAFFCSAETREGRVCQSSFSDSGPCFREARC